MAVSGAVRNRLLVESGHRCTVCSEKAYELHHIVEQAQGGDDSEENLIVLCPNCHQQRVHRNKEFTPVQLRAYKANLKERKEFERRLAQNLEQIRLLLEQEGPQAAETALRKEMSDAASVVDPERSPNAYEEVSKTARWLAERQELKAGAREALEIECDIDIQRELAKWKSISIVAVDEDGWKKHDKFPAAYSFVVKLSESPYPAWRQVFENQWHTALYMMKRETHIQGDRIVMIVADSDNLQNHLDHLKQLVEWTNRHIQDHVERRVKPDLERQRRQVLHEFDTIESLKSKVKELKL